MYTNAVHICIIHSFIHSPAAPRLYLKVRAYGYVYNLIVLLSYCEYSHTPPPYHTCPHMFRAPFIPATSLPFPRSTPADVSTCQALFQRLVRPAFRPLSPHLPNRLLPRLSPRPSPQGGPMAYRTYRYIIWYIINQIIYGVGIMLLVLCRIERT